MIPTSVVVKLGYKPQHLKRKGQSTIGRKQCIGFLEQGAAHVTIAGLSCGMLMSIISIVMDREIM